MDSSKRQNAWKHNYSLCNLFAKASVVLLATLISGCASYTANAPIQKTDRTSGYRIRGIEDKKNSNTLWVGLAFSGGGTRSAAFSYGLLEQLRKTEISWEGKRRRLLDEVDSISSVSGEAENRRSP